MQFNFKAAGGCFKYSTNVLNKKGKSGGFMGGLALGFLLVASQSKLKYDCHVIETKKTSHGFRRRGLASAWWDALAFGLDIKRPVFARGRGFAFYIGIYDHRS